MCILFVKIHRKRKYGAQWPIEIFLRTFPLTNTLQNQFESSLSVPLASFTNLLTDVNDFILVVYAGQSTVRVNLRSSSGLTSVELLLLVVFFFFFRMHWLLAYMYFLVLIQNELGVGFNLRLVKAKKYVHTADPCCHIYLHI